MNKGNPERLKRKEQTCPQGMRWNPLKPKSNEYNGDLFNIASKHKEAPNGRIQQHQWSSGRIHRCHRCDPGSIPG